MHLSKCAAEEDCVGANKKSSLWEYSSIELMVVSTLVRFFKVSLRSSSLLQREESTGLSPCPLMGGMRERMLNPVLSLALSNDLVICVWSIPCTSSPLLSVLKLLGQQT